jgi:hypothetical protein
VNQNLKNHVDELFQQAPKTRATYELKEEILSNANDRYVDLINDQIPEQEALDIVIHSIGNVDDLFSQTEERTDASQPNDTMIKKIALYKTIAIGMYLFGFLVSITIDELFPAHDSIGVILMLAIAAIATVILVYISTAYPKYKKQENTIVEDFKDGITIRIRRKPSKAP